MTPFPWASLGRWISRDPTGEENYTNLYLFNGNSPINKIDLFGLWSVDGVLKILCCKQDKWVVDYLNRIKIFSFTYWKKEYDKYYKVFDSKGNWVRGAHTGLIKYDELGGVVNINPKNIRKSEVGFLVTRSDEDIAATLYHEITHLTQPLPNEEVDLEIDAWLKTTDFKVRHIEYYSYDGAFPGGWIIPGYMVRSQTPYIFNTEKIVEDVRTKYSHKDKDSIYDFELRTDDRQGYQRVNKKWSCKGVK